MILPLNSKEQFLNLLKVKPNNREVIIAIFNKQVLCHYGFPIKVVPLIQCFLNYNILIYISDDTN